MDEKQPIDSERSSTPPASAGGAPSPAECPGSGSPPFKIALGISRQRLAVALVIAAISDAISFFAAPFPPIVWSADVVTAVLLFIVLGWHWVLLPGLVLEAIPGVGMVPFWLLVVVAIALWGTARPKWLKKNGGEKEAPSRTKSSPP
jgi:hypothetical protein